VSASMICPKCRSPLSRWHEREHMGEPNVPIYACAADRSEACAIIKNLREIVDLVNNASFDHSCGLEGWDGACSECVLARALWEYNHG
jgi:hypothetical protein